MTAQELINLLGSFPPDMPVLVPGGGEYGWNDLDPGDVRSTTVGPAPEVYGTGAWAEFETDASRPVLGVG